MDKQNKFVLMISLLILFLFMVVYFWVQSFPEEPYLPENKNYPEPEPEYTPPKTTATYRNIPKHFEWDYGYGSWTYDIAIPSQNYQYYLNKLRQDAMSTYYLTYDDSTIMAIAKTLSEKAEEEKFSKTEFAAAFIQSLNYVPDEQIGYDEYPKFPVETLVEETGDCEDMSYLTASIILAMGIDTVLIVFDNHMAVGVWCSNCHGTYYELDERQYFYLETTGEGYGLGDIPDEYDGQKARIIKI